MADFFGRRGNEGPRKKTMPTLILTPRFSEDAQALWRAAGQLGWDVERLTSWRVPERLRSVSEPVLYLEALMGPAIAEQLGLTLADPPDDWLPRLPEEYLRRWVYLTTLREAHELAQPAFVKPPNDKSFPASIYHPTELPEGFPDEMPVLVAEVVTWQKEFRCFVLDRRLRTFSVYLRGGELQQENAFACPEDEESDLRAYVEQLLSDQRVDLPRATVIDVGVIDGRGWAVVEQNAAWGAGLYGCDAAEVLEVLRFATAPSSLNAVPIGPRAGSPRRSSLIYATASRPGRRWTRRSGRFRSRELVDVDRLAKQG